MLPPSSIGSRKLALAPGTGKPTMSKFGDRVSQSKTGLEMFPGGTVA